MGSVLSFGLFGLFGLGTQPVHAKAPDEQLICIDPGHQRYGNNGLEPVAPGAKERKPKVSSGTAGVKTKKPEYVLTLEASRLLKDKLESYGYRVVMVRDSHDVDITNIERAQMCNDAQADLAVRIHADGDASPKTQGISLLYPAPGRDTESLVAPSKEAAELILREAVAATGAVSRGVVPRSDLTGFNWSTVPSVLVEMGFMTNPAEDAKLSDPEYLNAMTEGIANGINAALAARVDAPVVEESSRVFLPAGSAQLYDLSGDGRMLRTKAALSPQVLQVSAVMGSWGRVSTWMGERWVYLGHALSPVQAVNKQVELADNTPLYRSPHDAEPLARLTAQRVGALEQWNEWFLIDTWMGPLWITPSK
ncbi:N-acetylmuramoyl-L-alanine amidase [Paenibacillus cremeus]|uniref:N-acetylmuramoyl-L-alanine amidase n=2 Tax=Paenibacillus cremeus TaxID=2163881 RepID=A0A559KIR3_9BACL|nr:N-acetylmuramoyl-L-alanine amidase [Paenibacillus cremeus]